MFARNRAQGAQPPGRMLRLRDSMAPALGAAWAASSHMTEIRLAAKMCALKVILHGDVSLQQDLQDNTGRCWADTDSAINEMD